MGLEYSERESESARRPACRRQVYARRARDGRLIQVREARMSHTWLSRMLIVLAGRRACCGVRLMVDAWPACLPVDAPARPAGRRDFDDNAKSFISTSSSITAAAAADTGFTTRSSLGGRRGTARRAGSGEILSATQGHRKWHDAIGP